MPTSEPKPTSETRLNHATYEDERKSLVSAELSVSASFDKSVLTLAGGALLASMTFLKDIVHNTQRSWCLGAAWLALALVICAMLTSMLTSQTAFRRQRAILDDY